MVVTVPLSRGLLWSKSYGRGILRHTARSNLSTLQQQNEQQQQRPKSNTRKNDAVNGRKRIGNGIKKKQSGFDTRAMGNALKNTMAANEREIKSLKSESKVASSSKSKSTLEKCNEIMSKLVIRRNELSPPPIGWLYSEKLDEEDLQTRLDLYRDTTNLINAIDLSVKSRRIKASSGRENRDLNAILGNTLLICSETPPIRLLKLGNSTSEFPCTSDTCIQVLSILEQLNLDIQPVHHFCTIRAANQEHDWKLASSLFRKQIDPDLNGLVPVDTTLGWDGYLEMGLFGLARELSNAEIEGGNQATSTDLTISEGGAIVEGVLDAVRDMCLVSPTDQEKYVLAAGSALGLVGEWKGCINYLAKNPDVSEFGQPLLAAMMNACYLSREYNAVLHLYYDMIEIENSGAGEWQWAGQYSKSHPLCTDLMLRSIGLIEGEEYDGLSDSAMLVLRGIIEDDGYISTDAVRGILNACKRDANFEGAIEIFQILQDNKNGSKIVGEYMENFLYTRQSDTSVNQPPIFDADILASILESCNSAGEFGLALLCLRMSDSAKGVDGTGEKRSLISENNMVEQFLNRQPEIYSNEKLFSAVTTSLVGLHCFTEASQLESEVKKSQADFIGKHVSSIDHMVEINTLSSNVMWREAYSQIDRLLKAKESINQTNYSLSKTEQTQISRVIAKMLRHSVNAGQHNAGLYVARYINTNIAKKKKSSMKDTVVSFFGFDDHERESGLNLSSSSDELLSAMTYAYEMKYNTNEALYFFFSEWDRSASLRESPHSDTPDQTWIKSCNTALRMLIKQDDLERAVLFYKAIKPTGRNPETFTIMAKAYVDYRRWNNVAACYADAKRYNCLSEQLAFYALEDIANDKIQGKIKVLRSVAADIAKVKGLKTGAWIADNYWELKRSVGFHYVRLLMWWNDPNETQFRELQLAKQHFDRNRMNGLATNKDVLACLIKLADSDRVKASVNAGVDGQDSREAAPLICEAVLEICYNFNSEDRDLMADGIYKLVEMGAKKECKTITDLIEYNGIPVDDELLYSARSVIDQIS
uniref:Uncharacterized protein n=1 Tax=Chaetoceros debilis TaxID=122233 RepID=A0A7S3V6R3_9STRA